jgi:hypothetical protein
MMSKIGLLHPDYVLHWSGEQILNWSTGVSVVLRGSPLRGSHLRMTAIECYASLQ